MIKINRKPDMETENFRAWKNKPSKKDKAKLDKESENMPFVDLGNGNKFILTGYNIVSRKSEKKPIFAYKFKHEEKKILFWCAEDLKEEEKKIIDKIISMIQLGEGIGYNIIDSREWIKTNIGSQIHILDKNWRKK